MTSFQTIETIESKCAMVVSADIEISDFSDTPNSQRDIQRSPPHSHDSPAHSAPDPPPFENDDTMTMTIPSSKQSPEMEAPEETELVQPLLLDGSGSEKKSLDVSESSSRTVPPGFGEPDDMKHRCISYIATNAEFFRQAKKFMMCFCGLQASYLTWGYMQELIMTSDFIPTENVPDGKFPSAAFCVFSNRFLAVIVALIAVRIKHGAVVANNVAPLWAFAPCALSNTISSWSQYASLKYVSFPTQTVFKSSKIIPVMIMGMVLSGTKYPLTQYVEALLITIGVAIFSVASKSSDDDNNTELAGLIYLLCYIGADSFTAQWQDKVYRNYGRENVDPYQMMLGVNVSAILMTTTGLLYSNDFPLVFEFLRANPNVLTYNIITAITSASGQLCIFYTIKEFGPIAFVVIMTTRQMFSICISAVVFGHVISWKALFGAVVVFSVLFYQIRRKYYDRMNKNADGSK